MTVVKIKDGADGKDGVTAKTVKIVGEQTFKYRPLNVKGMLFSIPFFF